MIKVMLIDDEPEIRKLLHKMVEKQDGYQVVSECGDFAGAVADFARYRPDVAFVDIDLNGEDGLNCARVLTELDPKLKIIFATAHSEYMANAFEIYAFDYLVKPFNMERLVRTLDRIRSSMADNIRQSGTQFSTPFSANTTDYNNLQNGLQPDANAADYCNTQNGTLSSSSANTADNSSRQQEPQPDANTADSHNTQNGMQHTANTVNSNTSQNGPQYAANAVNSNTSQNGPQYTANAVNNRNTQNAAQSGTNAANDCSPQENSHSPDRISRPDRYRGKLLIKGKDYTCLLDVADILFIERVDGSTNIVTASGEQYKTSASLSDLETKLDSESFMRCHKSYIINLSKITRIEPYGRWTYVAKFRDCELSALMTAQKYEEIKKLFS